MDFYVPNYLESDYDNILTVLGENCVLNCYTTPTSFVGLITDRQDINENIRVLKCSRSLTIKKGDYVSDADSNIFLINEIPYVDVNCTICQMRLCGVTINFERWSNSTLNSLGVVTGGTSGYTNIASSSRGYILKTSVGQYDAFEGMVGLVATQKLNLVFAYNEYTQNIRISDEFSYKNTQYIVTNIDLTNLNTDGTTGLIGILGEVLEGGRHA